MKHLFLKSKPSAVLLLMKDSQQAWYPSKLARAAGASYVHTVNLLSELLRQGVVSQEKKGRQKFYRLTDRGSALCSSLDDFAKRCEAASQDAARQIKSPEAAASSQQQSPLPAEQQKQPPADKKAG